MCKAHSKVTHIKQQKYFHHLKGRGYNKKSVFFYIYKPVKTTTVFPQVTNDFIQVSTVRLFN